MTILEIVLMIAFYLFLTATVAYFTRAKVLRIVGALSGGAVFASVALPALAFGELKGWWHVPNSGSWTFQLLLWIGFAVSCVPTYLVLWRVVRRFGGLGLAVSVIICTLIGPPRDYWIAAMFPSWMTFAPGIAPVIADATLYALLVLIGHAVMRLVVGAAQSDPLALRLSAANRPTKA